MSDQIELAAAVMVRDYFILAFIVSLGALQIVTSISGIRGLWVLPRGDITRVLGIVLIAIGLGYYIFSPLWLEGPWSAGSVIDGTSEGRVWGTATLDEISGARNLNDIHGGMAGTAYGGLLHTFCRSRYSVRGCRGCCERPSHGFSPLLVTPFLPRAPSFPRRRGIRRGVWESETTRLNPL